MTDEDIRRIEAQWKSDVDMKLDRLIRFADAYEAFIKVLLEREVTRKKWRDAVIEKSTIGFVIAAVGFIALAIWEYLRAHLK